MLSPRTRSQIRTLWGRFWSGGIANPLTAIEQITYLVYLKRLEDLDREREQRAHRAGQKFTSIYAGENSEKYRWSYIRSLQAEERVEHVRDVVFPWMKNQSDAGDRMRDAVFIISSANLLQGAVEILDGLLVAAGEADTLGDIYEHLLGEIAEAGKNGQFRTPRHIIRAMCYMIDPQPGQTICDPACGTAGFLVNAYQHILTEQTSPKHLEFEADGTPIHPYGDMLSPAEFAELRHNHLYGFDFDRTMVRLGWMNMKLHGLNEPQINYADTLGSRFNHDVQQGKIGAYNVVLANPPFTGSIDRSDIGANLQPLKTGKTELLFLDLILDLLQVGGQAAVIVPEGVLFGSTGAHKIIRRKLVTEHQLDAVVSLPAGVFQPYTSVKTSILLFKKRGDYKEPREDDVVWFYEVASDGLALNAKRTEQPERNDLWDMMLKYRLRSQPDRKPAFCSDTIWRAWQAFSSDERSQHAVQPLIVEEEREPDEAIDTQASLFDNGQRVRVKLFKGLETRPLDTPKDWTVPITTLATSDYRLDAGFHRPEALDTAQYADPLDIIVDLRQREIAIQRGLRELKSMLEGKA